MTHASGIEIVGGGLAGLSLGAALARQGVAVTVFEAGAYPRHRVCGEFIAGLASTTVARLALAPLLEGAREQREVAWFLDRHGRPARRQRLPSPALGMSRATLDARLAAAFVAAGGELRTSARVGDLRPREGRILATGHRAEPSSWLGLKMHVHELPRTSDLEVHLGDGAYLGLVQVDTGAINVCGLFRCRALHARGGDLLLGYLRAAGLETLARRIERARLEPGSFRAVAALDFDRRVPARSQDPDGVRVGDSCAMIPPFTGNGMAMAFQSAEAALDPLLDYARGKRPWRAASAAIHAAQQRRFRLRLASAAALHRFLLEPPRQRVLAALDRARLLPLRPIFAALH